jgi:hypothetical protein
VRKLHVFDSDDTDVAIIEKTGGSVEYRLPAVRGEAGGDRAIRTLVMRTGLSRQSVVNSPLPAVWDGCPVGNRPQTEVRPMRMMARVEFGLEKGNEVLKSGAIQDIFNKVMDQLKPEAAYFGPVNGTRGCYLVVDMDDSAQLPAFSETLFAEMHAKIEWFPVMNVDDLQRGLQELRSA